MRVLFQILSIDQSVRVVVHKQANLLPREDERGPWERECDEAPITSRNILNLTRKSISFKHLEVG